MFYWKKISSEVRKSRSAEANGILRKNRLKRLLEGYWEKSHQRDLFNPTNSNKRPDGTVEIQVGIEILDVSKIVKSLYRLELSFTTHYGEMKV